MKIIKKNFFAEKWKPAGNLAKSAALIFPATACAGVISNAPSISSILLNALKFLLYIFGFLAIIGIVVSGVMYVLSRGDRRMIEKSKQSFLYALTGIIAALASLLVVRLIAKIITG